jgi:propanol-preferring alcohol dehydrogenase
MRALVLENPSPIEDRPLRLVDLPRPEAGRGQLLVRVHMCGVCHTDLHEAEGDIALPRRPIIPGHQIVGTVEGCGRGVRGFRLGERVGIAWLHQTCGRCGACRRQRENLCAEARFTGLHADGGYAEYTVVPAAFAYRLPERFPDEQAAPLLCAGIIGFRAFGRSGARPGDRLGLYGFGASAHVTIQVARHRGCEVHVVTRRPEHQEHARRLGAAWVGGAGARPPAPLQAAIVFAPAGKLVPEVLEALAPGGTCALAGIHMTGIPPLDYARHLYLEKTLTSVTAATRRDGRDLLALAAAIPIRTDVETFPLEQANEVLARVKESAIRGAAVLRV